MDRKPIASSLRPAYSWGRARVAELVDAPDLGSGAFGCAGSSPALRTSPVDTGPFPMGRLRDGQAERLAAMKADWEAWNASMPPIPDDATVSLGYSSKDMPQR